MTTPLQPQGATDLPAKSGVLLAHISHNSSVIEKAIDEFARQAIAEDRRQRAEAPALSSMAPFEFEGNRRTVAPAVAPVGEVKP